MAQYPDSNRDQAATREIGVRIALGAQRGSVYRLILREAGVLALAGIVIGTGCAIVVASLMRKLLFGTPPWDAMTPRERRGGVGSVSVVGEFPSGASRRVSRSDDGITLRVIAYSYQAHTVQISVL